MCHLYWDISRKFSFEDIAVLFFSDCSQAYWLEFPKVRRLKNLRGSGGAPLIRGKTTKKFKKVKSICWACKSRF
jgi:hypothetical protein